MSFCPEGRLRQIEFAMEAIGMSNTTIGIKSREGIVIATEKKDRNIEVNTDADSEKIFLIDLHITCVVTGALPDSQILIEYARAQAQQYKKIYQDLIPIKKILEVICDVKQQFTHKGGQRPFGVSFLVAGWDSSHGLQLFRTDPSGTFSGWNAVAVGSHSIANQSILTEEYNTDIDLGKSLSILVKIWYKKASISELSKLIDVVVLSLDDRQKILIHKMNSNEIDSLIFSLNDK